MPGKLGTETPFTSAQRRTAHWDAAHLHNGLWAPQFLGYAATAMHWWWDDLIDRHKLWSEYRGIARYIEMLLAQGLSLRDHAPHAAVRVSGIDARVLAMSGRRSALLWVRSRPFYMASLRTRRQ